jgi:CBS domain-containing protein
MRRLDVRSVGHVTGAVVVDSAPGETLVRMAERYGSQDACVVDAEGRYRGMITNRELQAAILARDGLAATLAGDLMRTDLPTVGESDSLAVAFERLSARGADAIAVVEPSTGRYLGVLTRERLMQAYGGELAKDG